MNRTTLELPSIWPIRVWDHRPDGGTWILPSLDHSEAISSLWIVLEQIVDDWKKYSSELSFPNFNDQNFSKEEFFIYAFQELKPRFINCLFSYINFFFLLENGFGVLFSEIKGIAKELNISIKVPKRPKRTTYLQRLRRVRDNTVVHWGGPENKEDIDSLAGREWGFSFPRNADTLEDISFGVMSLVGAKDRELKTLAQTHTECVAYLRQFDNACASMLREIIQTLPLRRGTREYVNTNPVKP